jgi:hypothetical protein
MKYFLYFLLIVFGISTCSTGACFAWGYLRARDHEQKKVEAREAQAKTDQERAKLLCEAAKRLNKPAAELTSKQVLDSVAEGDRVDSWGQPFEYQPWDNTVRSFGPDKQRGTGDDLLSPCEH